MRTTTLSADQDQLEVADLSDGLYVVEVNAGSTSARMKLIVQH